MTAETSVCYRTWRTELWLSLRAEPTPALTRWLASLLHDEVDALDLLASRFRPDSTSSAVSRNAGRWTPVAWDFVEVLTAALEAAGATGGFVDPLLGRAVVAAGYDTWAGQDSGIQPGGADGDWREIEVRCGRTGAQVRIPPGTALDLGAVAKGWLADRLATVAHDSTGLDAVANMGGDLRVVSPATPWVVAADADVPGVDAVSLEIDDAGLATSSTGHRRWEGGHHIIDPRTGKPAASPWTSVSVLAATAAGANAAATAAMVAGTQGPRWLSDAGLDGWFVAPHGRQHPVGRWPQGARSAPVGA
jgi:FAD:protein FMN transferase